MLTKVLSHVALVSRSVSIASIAIGYFADDSDGQSARTENKIYYYN